MRNGLERAHQECVDKYGHGATTQALLAATGVDWTDAVPDDKIATAIAALKAVSAPVAKARVRAAAERQQTREKLNAMASAIYSRHGQHR